MSTMANKAAEYARLSDFFSRLASGDHHSLSKEVASSPLSLKALVNKRVEKVLASSNVAHDDKDIHTTSNTSSIAVDGDEAVAEFPPEGHQDFTFTRMLHSLYNLADFASMVGRVLAESQTKFQPLPEVLRTRKISGIVADSTDTEAAMRALKKRRMAAVRRSAAEDKLDAVAAFEYGLSSPLSLGDSAVASRYLPHHSRSSSMASATTLVDAAADSHEDSKKYDEEAVLVFVRVLCERQAAANKQQSVAPEVADLSPPSSASSTQTTFNVESVSPGPSPSPALRPRMKRRLSNY